MKLNILELRDIVAEVVRRTITEAKRGGRKPKGIPEKSEEVELAQRDRHVRGLKGYAHSEQNDFSKPLGPANLLKRQGASNMGNWTAEQRVVRRIKEMQLRKLVRMVVREEVRARRGR